MSPIMLLIRLYIATLSLVVCALFITTRGIGLLEGAVIAGPILFMIFDLHHELKEMRRLEEQITQFVESL